MSSDCKGGVGGEGGEGKREEGEAMGSECDLSSVPSFAFRFTLEEEGVVVVVEEVDGEGEEEKERASGSEGFLDPFRGSRTFLERCILTSISEPKVMSGARERRGEETRVRSQVE
jgi:hypothetical protein